MKKGNKVLMENIFSMLTLRGLEYILSFLLVPYMLRILGPANYGAIAFMQSIVSYFNLFIDFGFNLTAPRELAQAEMRDIPPIFSAYIWAKIALWLGVSILFIFGIIIVQNFTVYNFDYILFIAVYTSVLGNVLFPIWFFQGIQQMRYITIINLIGRFFTIGCIFLLVKKPTDYVEAAFFLSCTPLLAGTMSIIFIASHFPGILQRPQFDKIKEVVNKSYRIFISNLAVNLYTNSDIVILGVLTNNTIVGYYSGADKLIGCVKRGIWAVNEAVYPYISRKFRDSYDSAIYFLKKQLIIYSSCGILGGFCILFLSPYVIPWLLGDKYIPSIMPLQILAFVPFIVSLSNIFGYETMLPLGMESTYSRILLIASALNLIIIGPLIYFYGANGVSIAVMITEFFVMALMALILYRKGILL